MPVYQGERFVATAIGSVLAQTYPAIELVIVNDGSTDKSAAIIKQFLPHPKIRYIEQTNSGVADARNTAIGNSSGALVALLDQDDQWLPDKLACQVDYLETHPDVSFVHTRVECIDAIGAACSCIGAIADYPYQGRRVGQLLLGNRITASTVLMRASCIDNTGMFDQRFAPADDWELWLRIARLHTVGFIDSATALYRIHGANVSNDRVTMQRAALKVIDSIAQRFPEVLNDIGASQLVDARCRVINGAAEALEQCGRAGEARSCWKATYIANGNFTALLALLGLQAKKRNKMQKLISSKPWLERRLKWYAYKLSKWLETKRE